VKWIKSTDALFHEYDPEHQFNADDILHMHKVWLGDIYEWAGQYRKVNVSKGVLHFAMVAQIPKLMTQLETEQQFIDRFCIKLIRIVF